VVAAGAIRRAKLQSKRHHQQTNISSFFTGLMIFLSPNQHCQSTEGKMTINLKNSLVEGSSNLWLFMTVD